jgi:hypothetical protein
MGLSSRVNTAAACEPYQDDSIALQPMSRLALARLRQVKHGRVLAPMLFGQLSLERGYAYVKRQNANYLIAVDDQGQPIGAIGFQEDPVNKNLKGFELIAEDEHLRGALCGALVDVAEKVGAELVEVNVSAYDARLQQTFYDLGFRPVAYAPAFAFHGTERLDVVKMIKLNIPYDRGETKLTERAGEIVSMVEAGLK